MTNAIRVAPAQRRAMPRREYRNPPIHEVILDVQFQRSLEEPALRDLRGRLGSFSQAEQQNLMQVQMAVGPSGAGYQNMISQFGGWVFKKDGGWVLQTAPSSLTLH